MLRPLISIQDEDGESIVYGEEEFKIFKMDLATMTAVDEPLVGHFAVEGDNDDKLDWILHLAPDVSSDYVACGSETNGACLWDRHYGCLIKVFSPLLDQHQHIPQDRYEEETFVRSVAISRGSQDTMVTVAGHPGMVGLAKRRYSGRIKVYRSKKWIREN